MSEQSNLQLAIFVIGEQGCNLAGKDASFHELHIPLQYTPLAYIRQAAKCVRMLESL